MSVSLMQNALNSGEFSLEVEGRIDLPKYGTGLLKCVNFYPLVQGPIRRRGGTRYVAATKYTNQPTYLASFDFGSDQAYILEFGPLYVRFFANHGVVLSSPGVVLEVATPYTAADLTTTDGNCPLRFTQKADVLYIVHPSYPPQTLTRTSATAFTLAEFIPDGGPFEDLDPANTTKICVSARTGAGVTIKTDVNAFAATDVGRTIFIMSAETNTVTAWEPGKAMTHNSLRMSEGKIYEAQNNTTTGIITPTHTHGAQYDGDTGVLWQYRDPGYGWAQITGFTDAKTVTATVQSNFTDSTIGATPVSTRWSMGAWCSVKGFPDLVSFFRERLVFARGLDQRLWLSWPGDYTNFNRYDDSGNITNEQACYIQIGGNLVNKICWLSPLDILMIGTQGEEYTLQEQTTVQAFGPLNITCKKRSERGSRYLKAVRVGDTAIFVQRAGRRLRSFQFSQDKQAYGSDDLNKLNTNIIPYGDWVTSIAYQQEPYTLVWVTLGSGDLRSLTFNPEEQEAAWGEHPVGGSAKVLSVACIPAPGNYRDECWMICQRTINGASVKYVEYIENEFQHGGSLVTDAFYVDAGLTYDSTSTTTITGLGHLEGCTVDILADGAVHPQRVVASGAITLQQAASVVQVGLPCPCEFETLHIAIDGPRGTGHGHLKRINRISILFLDTLGGKIGPTDTTGDEIMFRDPNTPMGSPPDVFSGYIRIPFPGQYDMEGHVWYKNDQPLPATIVALQPRVELTENGS